jgi:hypothetical protein
MNQTLHLAERAAGNMRFNCAVNLRAKPPKMIIYQEFDYLIMRYPGIAGLFYLAPAHSTLRMLKLDAQTHVLPRHGPPLDYVQTESLDCS